MVYVPDPNRVADKWKRKASASVEDYRQGVENPRVDWKTATLNASDVWKEAVMQAAQLDLFRKGVNRVSTEEWKKKASELGSRRYAEGVQANADKYAQRIAKVLAILKEITLPPRGPRGDPKNIERVRVIAEALHQAKVEGKI